VIIKKKIEKSVTDAAGKTVVRQFGKSIAIASAALPYRNCRL